MPIRNAQQDHLLRLVQQMMAALERARGLRGGGRVEEGLEVLRAVEAELLGPLQAAARLVDPATAAHLVAEPLRIAAWARLLHEEAAALGHAGQEEASRAAAARAAELAREALRRGAASAGTLREVLGPLAGDAGGAAGAG
jgi:hypothetical protein